MSTSVFDLFSIGIGPSSSHCMGPMRAALAFMKLHKPDELNTIHGLTVRLHGSLAFTGIGHGTNKAILMGLSGEKPDTIDPMTVDKRVEDINKSKELSLLGKHSIHFDNEKDLQFDYEYQLPHHANGMVFTSTDQQGKTIHQETYYSIGGGFIISDTELKNPTKTPEHKLPHPFETAAELLVQCEKNKCTIAELMFENEKSWRSEAEIKKKLLYIAKVMEESIHNGCRLTTDVLPGGLKVRRRAPVLFKKLNENKDPKMKGTVLMEWLDLYAIAVNEENAAGHRIVTAPTNGAAGIIPAVIQHYKRVHECASEEKICDLLLTAAAIGILYKKNASISGAEMGCQGEVGVACSMAAGALAAVLGGTIYQVENAAEIGMEHNLGLTCDPVEGLVQIPCIERNAMGAVKAVNAARLALAGDGKHEVSLDVVIKTMREIGNNMNSIYKETSKGGLAVNIIEC